MSVQTESWPAWLTPADEAPHEPSDVPLWCENYLGYVNDHASEIGVWFHYCHTPVGGGNGHWEEIFIASLPGDEFLVAKGHSIGHFDGGVRVANVSVSWDGPFTDWVLRFDGAARKVSGDELRSGPLRDGPHTQLEMELVCSAITPPYDFGEQHLDNDWATGHYECHQSVKGTLRFDDRSLQVSGTGLRDHSWGPRDYRRIADTTWIHGQFPDSGRSFMVVHVTAPERPEPFTYAIVSDGTRVDAVDVDAATIPVARSLGEVEQPYELRIGDGTIRAEIRQTMHMAFLGAAEIGIGVHAAPAANHHYVEGLTRFEWDGEVGYGMTDRSLLIDEHPA